MLIGSPGVGAALFSAVIFSPSAVSRLPIFVALQASPNWQGGWRFLGCRRCRCPQAGCERRSGLRFVLIAFEHGRWTKRAISVAHSCHL